ncbi:hypothetical protein MAP00_000975 [Monascus purpureus]|nr:hypothetical protein MAP00_000975 [Monascus purpureus]
MAQHPDSKDISDVDVEAEGDLIKDGGDELGRQSRIVFEDSLDDDQRPTDRERKSKHARSRSRGTIRSTRSVSQAPPHADIPIGFRTLSFQIAESQNAPEEVIKERRQKENQSNQDYFESLDFHIVSPDVLCQRFNVDIKSGLSQSAAATRLQRDGPNVIKNRGENYLKKILLYVFGGFCSILWVGVIVFFICWQPLSNPPSPTNLAMAILIIIVIVLQASFSAFQDWSTKRVMNSILDLLPSEALVLRDGNQVRISSRDLVAGDIVSIAVGNKVPADIRILQSSGDVRFDRSILTGESDEIEGAVDCTEDNFLETHNIALMGTSVTNGNAVGIVVLTGSRSVMGRIAKMMNGAKGLTLIQKEINRFVFIVIALTVILAGAILFTWIGWIRVDHYSFMNVVAMLNDVMGCIVAFIPEGMPMGVALTLMMIANCMKKSNILPKGLSTVESLGCVNVICSDKTGTLTQNKMFVRSICLADRSYSVDDLIDGATLKSISIPEALHRLVQGSFLCNDAFFDPTTMNLPVDKRTLGGNATDCAILRFAETIKPNTRTELSQSYQRIHQVPFNSDNKWMLTMHKDPADENGYLVYVKGAPDILLPKCVSYLSANGEIRPLDQPARKMITDYQTQLSQQAERVIMLCQRHYVPRAAVGSNDFTDEILAECVRDLTVVGIFGIIDPPRPETAQTVAECRRAGIRFFMVTGDFGLTAAAIARNVGIFTGSADPDTVQDLSVFDTSPSDESEKEENNLRSRHSLLIEGPQMSSLTDEQWELISGYEEIVFARTTPEQKLRIVNEFKDRHNIVAVTGDGVNDAPALRAAHVGVAVKSGSDTAIEAADLVLLESFDMIIDAIRLGRLVFQNLQKLIAYLLPAGSWSEAWPVILNVFFGFPLPLSSFLMIIICVFTDLLCSLSLIMEKEEFDLLSLPPRDHRRDHLINMKIYGQSYLFIGVMEAFCAHCMFFLFMYREAGIPFHALALCFEKYSDGFYGYTQQQLTDFNNRGQCVYFVTLVIIQWGNLLSVRNKRMSLFQADPFRKQRRNPWLPLSMVVSLAIAIFVTEEPGLQRLFNTMSVPLMYWFIPVGLAAGVLMMDEFRKLLVRSYPRSIIARISW